MEMTEAAAMAAREKVVGAGDRRIDLQKSLDLPLVAGAVLQDRMPSAVTTDLEIPGRHKDGCLFSPGDL